MQLPNIPFPVTLESFQAYALTPQQRARGLTADELEMFQEIVETANEAYEAATRGDTETVKEILEAINYAGAVEPAAQHLSALCRGWTLAGIQAGMKNLKAAIDGIS